jgi:hypothetical protein
MRRASVDVTALTAAVVSFNRVHNNYNQAVRSLNVLALAAEDRSSTRCTRTRKASVRCRFSLPRVTFFSHCRSSGKWITAGAAPPRVSTVMASGSSSVMAATPARNGSSGERWRSSNPRRVGLGQRGERAPCCGIGRNSLIVDATGHTGAAHPIRAGLGKVVGTGPGSSSGGMQRADEVPPLPG